MYTYDKNLQNPNIKFVPTAKVQNMKTFYDPGELENKIKVKLMTCNKGSCHYASYV